MVKSKSSNLKIILTILLIALFLAGTVLLTLAWFSDKKVDEISFTITDTSLEASATLDTEITPNDLIAGNEFTKKLNLNFTSGVPFSYRIFVESSVPTNGASGTVYRTDLITLTNVKIDGGADFVLGADNKFYYATGSTLNIVPTSKSSETLVLTFKVSTLVNEDLVIKSTSDDSTKTKITYNLEYCEESALSEWSQI